MNIQQGNNGLKLKSGDKVVFFGDSITQADPGYVSFVAEMLGSLYSDLKIEIINRGIGGNNVLSLIERVHDDVLSLSPDWVSISIGVNDCHYEGSRIPLEQFESSLESLVKMIKGQSGATVLLCTPSIGNEDPNSVENANLGKYAAAVRRVAEAHDIVIVPIHEVFMQALRRAAGSTTNQIFTTDGVHLTAAGNTLFGTTWLKTLGAFEDLLPAH